MGKQEKSLCTSLLNILFPRVCFGCGRVGEYICKRCAIQKLSYIPPGWCHVCGEQAFTKAGHLQCKQLTYLQAVIPVAQYGGLWAELIAAVKYKFEHALIDSLADIMATKLTEHKGAFENSTLTYVPMSPYRKRWRGFNQSQLLAEKLASKLGVPCLPMLIKLKKTAPQATLNRAGRLDNLRSAFACSIPISQLKTMRHKQIVIVDDVFTTGATLEQCAKALCRSGFKRACGLVLAKD